MLDPVCIPGFRVHPGPIQYRSRLHAGSITPSSKTAWGADGVGKGAYLIYREHCTVLPIMRYAPFDRFARRPPDGREFRIRVGESRVCRIPRQMYADGMDATAKPLPP